MINTNEKELLKLTEEGETQKAEFKESLSLKDEIGKEVSAFSNTNQGRILIGVRDTKEVIGVQIGKRTVQELSNYIKTHTDNHVFPEISVEKIEGKKIVVIDVKESPEKPVFFKGKAYRRVGDSTHRLSASEIRKIAKESGPRMYWDEQICEEASLEDIGGEAIMLFLKEAKRQRKLDISEDAPIEETLMRLSLLRDGKLTNAAILLFDKAPQKLFIQSEVKCIRFKGTDVTGPMIDFRIIEGDVINQLKKAEDFIFEHIPMAAWIEERKLQRQEKWLYPPKAIREALANALAHRDYESPSKIQVRIFDDRIEFWNPGELMKPLTLEDLKRKHKSIPRNPLIAKQFFWIKYVEEVGSGTSKIVNWCVDWGLPEPEFEHVTGDFVVTFWKSKLTDEYLASLDLNERQRKAITYLKEHKKITKKEYMDLTNISKTPAFNDINDMLDKEIIIRRGSGRNAYYVLRESV